MGAEQAKVDVGLEEVRQRVSEWRATRPKLEPMPGELWDAAVALARERGVYRVARTVRVDYGTLKHRLEEGPAVAGTASERSVEDAYAVMTLPLPGNAAPSMVGAEVELLEADGSRLTIRLPDSGGLDVASVVAAFRRHAG